MFTLVQGSKYLATSFVQHVNGHFIAFVRCGGRWLKCDDSVVTDFATPSTIWPTLIFLEKYRRRSILGPSALRPAAQVERLRNLPLQLSRAVLEAGCGSGAGQDMSGQSVGSLCRRVRDVATVRRIGLFASGERLRRKNLQRSRKRTLSADASLPLAKKRKADQRRRTDRKQQRAGRKQQRAGRKSKEQRAGRQRKERRAVRNRKQQRAGRLQQRLESRTRQRTVFGGTSATNIDGRREDVWAEEDHPFNRFKANYGLFRAAAEEELREWPELPVSMSHQPCLLCEADFDERPALLQHINEKHGGLQRYRNAMLMLESLCPHVVVGSEVRHYIRNYATFLREARMDWEGSEDMSLRCRLGCCFCARSFWKEELWEVFIGGNQCFMQNPDAVWQLLSVERYQKRWPLIPEEELLASSVSVYNSSRQKVAVLLHKRRVDADMICGKCPAHVCRDCYDAFVSKQPKLCKFALGNDLWLGRPDPLLWQANMTHEMCLALARTVATKVVLRAGGAQPAGASNGTQWDAAFHQSGYIGSSVLFHNGDARHALESLPPRQLNDAMAITFCTDLPQEGQEVGRAAVSKIVELRLKKALFLEQAEALQKTNAVYAAGVAEINRELLTEWLQDSEEAVPPVVLDCVVTVPVGEDGPGIMRQEGPAQATADHCLVQQDETVFALESQVKDFNEDKTDVSSKIVSLLEKIDELEAAGARSVSVELATLMGEDTTLVDHLGRQRILQLCDEVQETCRKLSAADARRKLELELRDAVMGTSRWFLPSETSGEDPVQEDADTGYAAKHLFVARGKKPLSLFDWKIWSMAKPKLWRYGDAGNLFDREAPLSTREWAACLLLREAGKKVVVFVVSFVGCSFLFCFACFFLCI